MSDLLRVIEKYRNDRIAVYGLSIETQRVLNEMGDDFFVAGLLDGYRKNGMMYGKKIISFQEALDNRVKLILVAARPGSCRAIARRIGDACSKNGIALIDIRGRNLCRRLKARYDFKNMDGITKKQLAELIRGHDVVSVDLFDTLIMRRTLFPSDVFDITDGKLRRRGIHIADFLEKRMKSEKDLSRCGVPFLSNIYSGAAFKDDLQDISADELAETEWSADYDLLVPREELCSLLRDVRRDGKEIYITSDTYYTRKQIERILEKCGIDFYTDLFISCEYGAGKTQGLFEELKKRTGGKKCVHIGDDAQADVESAVCYGLAACRIYSGIDLLEAAGYFEMLQTVDNLSDRIKAGMFTAKLFNSPFQFETKERKISVSSAYDAGFLFFAPLLTDFVIWFYDQTQKYGLKNVWFGARDGYLIKKLYDELAGEASSVYFLVSRTAAVRAGIRNREDIGYISGMHFSGSVQEQLKERFGLEPGRDSSRTGLVDYAEEILAAAGQKRENYQKYINRLCPNEEPAAFFDFVAKGTTQMFLENIVPNQLKGLYFLQLENEEQHGRKADILSFCSRESSESSVIFDDYYILEAVLTSDMPSVAEFDADGKPVYMTETRSCDDIACIGAVQRGIYDYFRTFLKLHKGRKPAENRKLNEQMFLLIHGLDVHNNPFVRMSVEDRFFNRFTEISSLL